MPYLPLIPLPGDKKKISQADIKNNFTLLEDTYNGINEKIVLKEQAVKPTLAANQMALYTKEIGAISAMFLEKEDGTEVDFTTSIKSIAGWCKLPCGIIHVWFPVGNVTNGTTYSFATYFAPGTLPTITQAHHIQVTTVRTSVDLTYPVVYSSYNTTSVVLNTKNAAGHAGASIFFIGS